MGPKNRNIVWRPVNYCNYGRFYEVSTQGEVRRIGATVPLRPAKLKNGYCAVNLCYEGTQKTLYVHRLVALTFLDNPDPSRCNQVAHVDEIPEHNQVWNLFWATPLQNNLFGTHIAKQVATLATKRAEARRKKMGQRVPVTILRPADNGGVSGETFESIAEASRRTGTKRRDIKAVCEGIRRTAGGFRWVYAYNDDELKRIQRKHPDLTGEVSETLRN